MWNSKAHNCFSECEGIDYCFSFGELRGWGCRLLKFVPESLPTTEREKAKVFSAVYSRAEQLGVIHCKNFDSLRIEEVLDDDAQLRAIIELGGT